VQDALQAEYEQLDQTWAEAEEVPEAVEQRLVELDAALTAFANRPEIFAPEDLARAGAFVSIDASGALRVERGFVRPEDDSPVVPEPPEPESPTGHDADVEAMPARVDAAAPKQADPEQTWAAEEDEGDEGEGVKPLPDRLLTELTAHRTLALRHALGGDPDTAFIAALHVLCLRLFYRYGTESCLDIEAKSVVFGQQAAGLNDTALARAVDDRHRAWDDQLPKDAGGLWDTLVAFDQERRRALFAHCIALSLNAVHEAWNKRPRALAHADRIAEAVGLDMAAAGWMPTVDNYLGRVTKARILQAVREARGEHAAQLIEHLKKTEMAEKAQELLAGSRWLPEPLRTRHHDPVTSAAANETTAGNPVLAEGEDSPIIGGGPAAEPATEIDAEPVASAAAAE
jgi:ParB family chromosome partitioning protein